MRVLLLLLLMPLASFAEDNCNETLAFTFKALAADDQVNLCKTYQGKVILVVNTASKCGYTYQYDGLEALYSHYKEQGLVVLGFPSNDFSEQEPGTEKQIAGFCRTTFGVKFPMFEKTSVAQGQAHPFYKRLAKHSGVYPGWNFHKYLIDRDGNVVANFNSKVEPQDKRILQSIEKLL